MKRYPLAALVEASGLSEAALGRAVGLSGSTLVKARRDGLVESAADRYACRVGLVPWLIWGDWLDDCEVECPGCEKRFVPRRKNHRYCDQACYHRTYQREDKRRRYQEDPEFRAAHVAKTREYRAAAGRAISLKQRAYKKANRERLLARKRAWYQANRETVLAKQREIDRRRRSKKSAA